jgi:predicted transcriptional regulator
MNYLEAILQKLVGQRAIETQDLIIYLNSPVGVGEHSNIGEEVELKIEKIESINSKIETTQKLIEQLYKKKEADTTPN